MFSVVSQSIGDWNELSDYLISIAEVSDDCHSKFDSLCETDRGLFNLTLVTAPGEAYQCGLSPVIYSDSESDTGLCLLLKLESITQVRHLKRAQHHFFVR